MTYESVSGLSSGSVEPKSRLAVTAFILGLCGLIFTPAAIAAVICGHLALTDAYQAGPSGTTLAKTGVILGYSVIALSVLVIISAMTLLAVAGNVN